MTHSQSLDTFRFKWGSEHNRKSENVATAQCRMNIYFALVFVQEVTNIDQWKTRDSINTSSMYRRHSGFITWVTDLATKREKLSQNGISKFEEIWFWVAMICPILWKSGQIWVNFWHLCFTADWKNKNVKENGLKYMAWFDYFLQ